MEGSTKGCAWAMEDLGLAAGPKDSPDEASASPALEAVGVASDWLPGGAESSMSGTPAATMRATNSSGSMDSELALMVSMKDAAEYYGMMPQHLSSSVHFVLVATAREEG